MWPGQAPPFSIQTEETQHSVQKVLARTPGWGEATGRPPPLLEEHRPCTPALQDLGSPCSDGPHCGDYLGECWEVGAGASLEPSSCPWPSGSGFPEHGQHCGPARPGSCPHTPWNWGPRRVAGTPASFLPEVQPSPGATSFATSCGSLGTLQHPQGGGGGKLAAGQRGSAAVSTQMLPWEVTALARPRSPGLWGDRPRQQGDSWGWGAPGHSWGQAEGPGVALLRSSGDQQRVVQG